VQDFRKLRVWQRAHELSLAVKQAARAAFRKPGDSNAKSQLIRAADSIVSNIVEGCAAQPHEKSLRDSWTSASSLPLRSITAYSWHGTKAV